MVKVKVYSRKFCGYCLSVKEMLLDMNIDFEDISVDNKKDFDKLVKKTKWDTVPQVFVGGKFIGGKDELVDFINSGGFEKV